jgi:hypothetical protein
MQYGLSRIRIAGRGHQKNLASICSSLGQKALFSLTIRCNLEPNNRHAGS